MKNKNNIKTIYIHNSYLLNELRDFLNNNYSFKFPKDNKVYYTAYYEISNIYDYYGYAVKYEGAIESAIDAFLNKAIESTIEI